MRKTGDLACSCGETYIHQLLRGIFFKALGNVNVNYLKIPKKRCGQHKGPRGSHAASAFQSPCLRALSFKQKFHCIRCSLTIQASHRMIRPIMNHGFNGLPFIPIRTILFAGSKIFAVISTSNNHASCNK